VYSIVLDHARNQACSGSMDSSVRIWNLATGQCVHVLTGHTSLVGLLGLSHSYLVSAAADSTLRVWDPSTGELRHTLAAHTGAITCFQHDEFKILSGSDGTLKMWDIRDGTNVRDLLTGITGVWQVVFDGRWCVAASNRHDATFLDVWDFGNEVVGDGDEEWVGEGSVDGEDGDSELDEDVTGSFAEHPMGEMEQDEDEAIDEDGDEDMAEQSHEATSQELNHTETHSDDFNHRRLRGGNLAAFHSGDIDVSPHREALQSGSLSGTLSVSGTPQEVASSPLSAPQLPPTARSAYPFNMASSSSGSLLGTIDYLEGAIGNASFASTSGTHLSHSPSAPVSSSSAPTSATGTLTLNLADTLTTTPVGPRTMQPPALGLWGSSDGNASSSGGLPGPSSRPLGGAPRNDETPSRPSRTRRR
jgi:WD40 repeat protein